jgi:putative addiction module component (TIGR02574 family)
MGKSARQLIKEASGLPYGERAKIVDELLSSLDPIIEDDTDSAWYAELARREEALVSGKAKRVPWDDVKKQARGKAHG